LKKQTILGKIIFEECRSIDFPLILFYNIFCKNVIDNWVINAGEASYEGEE